MRMTIRMMMMILLLRSVCVLIRISCVVWLWQYNKQYIVVYIVCYAVGGIAMSWHKTKFKLWRAIIIIISSCRCPLNEVIKKEERERTTIHTYMKFSRLEPFEVLVRLVFKLLTACYKELRFLDPSYLTCSEMGLIESLAAGAGEDG